MIVPKESRRPLTGNRYVLSFVGLILIIAITIGILALVHSHAAGASAKKTAVNTPTPSAFSFSGATGWWQGATNKTSMAAFHTADGCFVSIQYETGDVTATEAKTQKDDADLTSSGYTITPGTSVPLTIQTNTGRVSYQLQQSTVITPPGSSTVEGGQEFGYVPLSSGSLFVEGYCDTNAQLAATIPALEAYSFNASKL